MVLAAFIGRLPLSMVGLGCVLLVASETGSYGLGGAIAAVGAVTTALAGPVIGRLADTRGQRRVLLPVLLIFVVSGLAFLVAIRHGWPLWTVFPAAGISGACIPPVSSMIRVRWTHLLRGSHRLPTALAMESVVDEFVFIVGPVLVPSCPPPATPPAAWSPPSPSPPWAACCSPRRPGRSRPRADARAA